MHTQVHVYDTHSHEYTTNTTHTKENHRISQRDRKAQKDRETSRKEKLEEMEDRHDVKDPNQDSLSLPSVIRGYNEVIAVELSQVSKP